MKTKVYIQVLIGTLLLAAIQAALPEIPDDAAGAKKWLSKREAAIEELSTKPTADQLDRLGEMLRQLNELNYRSCQELDQTIATLKSHILSIPNYADYYRDRATSERAKLDELERSGNPVLFNNQKYKWMDSQTRHVVLGYLPSGETVKVLGDFLNDDRGKQPLPPDNPTEQEKAAWAT